MERQQDGQPKLEKKLNKNPHKWLFDPVDVQMLCNALDGIYTDWEIKLIQVEGKQAKEDLLVKMNTIEKTTSALRQMNDQQHHLAKGIEALKNKLKNGS